MSGITEMEVDEGDSKPSAPKDTVVLHRNAVKVITSSNVRTITSVGQSRVSKITGLSLVEVYIIGFLKVCSLLRYKI